MEVGQEFVKILRSLKQFLRTLNSERSKQLLFILFLEDSQIKYLLRTIGIENGKMIAIEEQENSKKLEKPENKFRN